MENKTLERMLSSDIKMNRNRQFSLANQKWQMKYKKGKWHPESKWIELLAFSAESKVENETQTRKWRHGI